MRFLKIELNNKAYTSRNQNIRRHPSCYVSDGRAKMLIRCFRNNDTEAFRKYRRGNGKFPSSKRNSYRTSLCEICKILVTSWA